MRSASLIVAAALISQYIPSTFASPTPNRSELRSSAFREQTLLEPILLASREARLTVSHRATRSAVIGTVDDGMRRMMPIFNASDRSDLPDAWVGPIQIIEPTASASVVKDKLDQGIICQISPKQYQALKELLQDLPVPYLRDELPRNWNTSVLVKVNNNPILVTPWSHTLNESKGPLLVYRSEHPSQNGAPKYWLSSGKRDPRLTVLNLRRNAGGVWVWDLPRKKDVHRSLEEELLPPLVNRVLKSMNQTLDGIPAWCDSIAIEIRPYHDLYSETIIVPAEKGQKRVHIILPRVLFSSVPNFYQVGESLNGDEIPDVLHWLYLALLEEWGHVFEESSNPEPDRIQTSRVKKVSKQTLTIASKEIGNFAIQCVFEISKFLWGDGIATTIVWNNVYRGDDFSPVVKDAFVPFQLKASRFSRSIPSVTDLDALDDSYRESALLYFLSLGNVFDWRRTGLYFLEAASSPFDVVDALVEQRKKRAKPETPYSNKQDLKLALSEQLKRERSRSEDGFELFFTLFWKRMFFSRWSIVHDDVYRSSLTDWKAYEPAHLARVLIQAGVPEILSEDIAQDMLANRDSITQWSDVADLPSMRNEQWAYQLANLLVQQTYEGWIKTKPLAKRSDDLLGFINSASRLELVLAGFDVNSHTSSMPIYWSHLIRMGRRMQPDDRFTSWDHFLESVFSFGAYQTVPKFLQALDRVLDRAVPNVLLVADDDEDAIVELLREANEQGTVEAILRAAWEGLEIPQNSFKNIAADIKFFLRPLNPSLWNLSDLRGLRADGTENYWIRYRRLIGHLHHTVQERKLAVSA